MKNLLRTNITVMISDMDRSIEFYTHALHLELVQRHGDHYAEISSPGVNIGLHPGNEKTKYGDNLSIGFATEDFDVNVAYLKNLGIHVEVVPDGWSRIANFEDPDGNKMYMIEQKKE